MAEKTVLLIEDEPLITLLYQDVLQDTEYFLLEPLTCQEHVIAFLEEQRADVAVVDLYLDDGPCLAVIDRLIALEIPLLIVSGQGDAEKIAQERGLPLLHKPFNEEALFNALGKLRLID